MMELQLIPFDDLVKEIFNRTDTCVIAYTRTIDDKSPIIDVCYNSPNGWLTGVGLCEISKDSIVSKNKGK